jgi:hypothetical protein
MMHERNAISLIFLFLTVLCFSGCGGSGGGGSVASPNLSVSTSEIFFGGAVSGFPQPSDQTVTGTVTNYSGTLYLYIAYTANGIANVLPPVLNGSSGTSTIMPKSTGALGKGVYFDTITISACSDAGCSNHLPGSPKTINVTYVVGIATVPSTLSFSSAAGTAPPPQTVTVYHYQNNQNWASSYLFLSGSGWMNYSPPDGQSPKIVTVNVDAMPVGTPAGSVFNAEIRFGANAGTDLVTLPISYAIN